MYPELKFEHLIGKKITKLEIINDEVRILCGPVKEAFNLYHLHDYNASVKVHDVKGKRELTGTVIHASESISKKWPVDVNKPDDFDYMDSFTWTTYTLQTENGIVLIRWLGMSNGYYDESIYFGRDHYPLER